MSNTTYTREGNEILAADYVDESTPHGPTYKVADIDADGELVMVVGQGRAHRKAVEKYLEESGEVEGTPADIFPKPLLAGDMSGLNPTGVTHFDNVPPCPPESPDAGDKTPEVIRWWFKHKPEEAKTKYDHRRWDRTILD